MNKTITFARIRPDGTLEAVLSDEPVGPVTLEQIEEAARRGPETPPPNTENPQRMRLAPHVATLRSALALSQEEFAARYHIPLGTLRDWERGRTEPDQPMCAYLAVIARHPEIVRRALQRLARIDRSRLKQPDVLVWSDTASI